MALELQELMDIALRHDTTMASAMVEACRCKAGELGITLAVPAKAWERVMSSRRRPDPYELTDGEWRRLMERNSDTRWNHC